MKQQTVRTKWHRVGELLNTDAVYLTAPPMQVPERIRGPADHAIHYSEVNAELKYLRAFFSQVQDVPKFAIERELLDLVAETSFALSLRDLCKAKVLRLPFPIVSIEFCLGGRNTIVILFEDSALPKEMPREPMKLPNGSELNTQFHAAVFYVEKDEDGEYLVAAPAALGIGVYLREELDRAWFGIQGQLAAWIPESPRANDVVKNTYQKDAKYASMALQAALLLLTTQGVAKDVVEGHHDVNKSRVRSGKPPIPRHTYVRIGRVYRSAGVVEGDDHDEYIPRKSPRPHWRRAFVRRVRFGKGKQSWRWQDFPARLVAYPTDNVDDVKVPEYRVSR